MTIRICTMWNQEKDLEEIPLGSAFTTRRQSYGETDPVVLDFQHVGTKTNDVSVIVGRGSSLEALKGVLPNCVLHLHRSYYCPTKKPLACI